MLLYSLGGYSISSAIKRTIIRKEAAENVCGRKVELFWEMLINALMQQDGHTSPNRKISLHLQMERMESNITWILHSHANTGKLT